MKSNPEISNINNGQKSYFISNKLKQTIQGTNHKSLKILHFGCIRWYCSNRGVRKNLKTKHASQYPKIVTQMINGEILNPAPSWVSDDKAQLQSASFETLIMMKVELTKDIFINDDSMIF